MASLRFSLLAATFVLSAPLSQAALMWVGTTGGGNGTSLFAENNWVDTLTTVAPPAGTVDGNTPVPIFTGGIIMDGTGLTGTNTYGPYGPNFDLGGNTLSISAGNLQSSATNGLRSNAGGAQSTILASSSATINVQFLLEIDLTLTGAANLILRGGGDPINNTNIDLSSSWTGSITTLNELPGDWTDPTSSNPWFGDATATHLDKITVDGAPAVLGVNVQIVPNDPFGGTGAILTVIPEPSTALLSGLALLAFLRRRR